MSLLVHCGLIGSAVYFRKTQPVYSLAVFWFFAMHLLESTYLPLELYFEHRNYMAMIGPLIAIAWYLHGLLSSKVSILYKRITQLAIALYLGISIASTWQLTNIWGDA